MPLHTFTHEATGAQVDVYLHLPALCNELRFERRPATNRFIAAHDMDVWIEINHPTLDGVNEITLQRERVPQRVNTPKIVQTDYQANRVMRGYRELEDAGKLRKSSFTPDQVKRAWAMPDNEG